MTDEATEPTPSAAAAAAAVRGSQARAEAMADFAERFLTQHGARLTPLDAISADGSPRLEATLGDELAAHFERPALQLGAWRDDDDALRVAPGGRIFESMMTWMRARGRICWLPLRATHSAIDTLPEVDQPDHLEGPPEVVVHTGYDLELVVRATFVSEERHEDLLIVHVPEHGAAEVVDSSVVESVVGSGHIVDPATRGDGDTIPTFPIEPLIDARIGAGLREARRWAREHGREREDRILEHLSRELQRLTHYFGDLMAEQEDDDDKRETLATELDRRVAEEVAKHRLTLELDALMCAIVARPLVSFIYKDADGDRWIYDYDRVTGEVRKPVVERRGRH